MRRYSRIPVCYVFCYFSSVLFPCDAMHTCILDASILECTKVLEHCKADSWDGEQPEVALTFRC